MKSKEKKQLPQKIRDTIKLDFDGITEKQLIKLLSKRAWVIQFFKIRIHEVKAFRTGHGYHVYIITYKRFSNKDLVFTQAVLGSDFMRESFYWKRIKYPVLKKKGWNILFNQKFYTDGTYMKEQLLKRLTKKLDTILKGGNKNKKQNGRLNRRRKK